MAWIIKNHLIVIVLSLILFLGFLTIVMNKAMAAETTLTIGGGTAYYCSDYPCPAETNFQNFSIGTPMTLSKIDFINFYFSGQRNYSGPWQLNIYDDSNNLIASSQNSNNACYYGGGGQGCDVSYNFNEEYLPIGAYYLKVINQGGDQWKTQTTVDSINLTFNNPTGSDISIISPTASSTISTFNKFSVDYYVGGTQYKPLIKVEYKDIRDFYNIHTLEQFLSTSTLSNSSGTIDINIGDLIPNGTYQATAKLYSYVSGSNQYGYLSPGSSDLSLLATSPTINFTITSSTAPADGPTPPKAGETGSMCASSNVFANALCNLFKPDSDSLSASLRNLYNGVIKKPPFGYLSLAKQAFDGLTEGSSSTDILSASTTAAFSEYFSPLRSGFSWILYLMFGVWIIIRIRHLEL